MFTSVKQNGINVIRFFPFGILGTFTLQTAPGTCNKLKIKARRLTCERQTRFQILMHKEEAVEAKLHCEACMMQGVVRCLGNIRDQDLDTSNKYGRYCQCCRGL